MQIDMIDCGTAVSNVETFCTVLNDETCNDINKQKRKKHKHDLAEAESTPHLSIEKETNYEIIQLDDAEKSNDDISNKLFKKKKHKVNNEKNVSNCRFSKINVQDFENNANIEIPKESNKWRKKDKHGSIYEMENMPNNKNKESSKGDNNRILDELYKRKRHKQKALDNMSYCLSSINSVELSQNDLNNAPFSGVHKQKRNKKQKLFTTDNFLKTAKMELSHISYDKICCAGVEEGIEENSASQSISKLNRKNNRHSISKEKNHQKNKYKSTNDSYGFDCKIVEQTVIEKSDNDINPNKIHKKKRKHNAIDDENASECKIAETLMEELGNDTFSKFFKGLRKQKKKKDKHNLLDETNVLNQEESVIDKSGKNVIQDVLEVHKREGLHKQFKEDNLIYCKTVESNAVESDQNGFNRENSYRLHGKKKKKCKLFNEMKNTSDCETADFTTFKVNQNDSNSENVNIFHEKKEKKREKRLLDEMKNATDFETVDSNYVEINQGGLNSKNVNRLHKKKKKKHKNKLHDAIQNASDSESVCSNPIDTNQIDLNKFHKKRKRKHENELFSVGEDICNGKIQESVIEAEKSRSLDTLHVKERKKYKPSDVDKISDHKTIDSGSIGMNPTEFSNKNFNQIHKEKRKNHRQNLAEVECMAKTVTESSNTSNNIIHHEYTKEFTEKSILQNPIVDISPRTKKQNKEHVVNSIEILSDNLQEKEKNVMSKVSVESYQEAACMSFDPFIHDMTDTPVSFPVPLLHEDETVCSITAERRAYLEKNGVTIHTGKWTKVENEILIRNFQQFGLEFGVNNPFQLLGINQTKKDNEIEKFKKAKHFLVHLGRDLDNRSLRSIYMRARKLLTPFKNRVKLSAKETTDLKHAYQLVGNKWTRISDMLSISEDTCHTAFRWHKDYINKGKWTLEEERNLIKAIKTVSGEEDISANNLKSISWKAVAKYVPTRNEFQCHKHWAEHLAWDSSVSEKKSWKKSYYGKLIYLLKEKYCFNSEHEIDWRELHKHFNDVAPSYIFLHKKWLYLKGRLPKKINLSYTKCLDTLKNKYGEEYKMFAVGKL